MGCRDHTIPSGLTPGTPFPPASPASPDTQRTHRPPSTSTVVLEYSSEGRVVATGYPYGNRYISVVTIKDRKVTQWRDYLDPLRAFAALDDRPFEPNAPA
jgi:ketosteroid isomerase-like protein